MVEYRYDVRVVKERILRGPAKQAVWKDLANKHFVDTVEAKDIQTIV